jgi:hypothetical protein
LQFFARTIPGYSETLLDASSAGSWWFEKRPVILQSAPLGPIDSNQRFEEDVAGTVVEPPDPVFQGVRLVEVEQGFVSRVRWVSLSEIANG